MGGLAAPVIQGMKFHKGTEYLINRFNGYVVVAIKELKDEPDWLPYVPDEFRDKSVAVDPSGLSDDQLLKLVSKRGLKLPETDDKNTETGQVPESAEDKGEPEKSAGEDAVSETESAPVEDATPAPPLRENPAKMSNPALKAKVEELGIKPERGWKRNDFMTAYVDFYEKAEES